MLSERIIRYAVPLLSVVIVVGAALYSLIVPDEFPKDLESIFGHTVTLEGVVVGDADQREKTTHLTVEVKSINGVGHTHATRVLLFADVFEQSVYGDRIQIKGVLKKPEAFETDAGRTFNYPKYLRAHGVLYTMSFPTIVHLRAGGGNWLVARLLAIKHLFIKGIERALPEPESALLSGLLLGEKQSLGEKITKAFRNAGVVHIIVLSGYNVALVIQCVSFIFLRLFPRIVAYSASALFVVAFAVMTGASETTMRALFMALLMMLATVLHRPKAALRVLAVAAAIMALMSPYVVLYDLSFQLSILATLGLILFSSRIEKHLSFIPDFKYLPFREIVSTTLATQITVLPLLIVSVGAVSLVFLPANILVLPAVPLAMFVGFFASLASLLVPILALPFNGFSYLILSYIISVADFFGNVPFASAAIPHEWMMPLLAVVGVLYITIGWRFLSIRKGSVTRQFHRSNF